ncbi:MAG: rsbW [Mycobacterium sp.]|jgi:serine/threonine-protein kinase RsbW|nr:rsbW [Mycobacterium sp.]
MPQSPHGTRSHRFFAAFCHGSAVPAYDGRQPSRSGATRGVGRQCLLEHRALAGQNAFETFAVSAMPSKPGGADDFEITLAGVLTNLALVCTIVGIHAQSIQMDSEATALLTLAVDEAWSALILRGDPSTGLITLRLSTSDLGIWVEVVTSRPMTGDPLGDFAWHVLTALVDDVHSFQRTAAGAPPRTGVRFEATLDRVTPC